MIREYKVSRNNEARSFNHGCGTKSALYILSVYFYISVFSMQCACAVMTYVDCPTIPYTSTLSKKRKDFLKVNEHNVFLSTTMSEPFLSLQRTKRDMAEIYIGLQIKYPLCLSDSTGT